jgi:cellulose synthase/poly-beta-1,6-N-acetylglucosamine synthase-like glycosyltransferase
MPGVVAISMAALAYTYAGYPLLVAALARLAPGDVREDPTWRPTVTACVPVHGDAPYVAAKLESLLALDYPEDRLDVLVYSDAASEATREAVRAIAARTGRVRLIEGAVRRGKPHALNRMAREARGEVLLLTDARQRVAPGSLLALVRVLADPRVGCASGELALEGDAGAGVYWRYESFIRRSEARFRGMVGVTGPLYAIRRADLDPIPEDIVLDDLWVPMRLCLAGRDVRLAEGAVAYDEAFEDDRELGRKIRTLAGNAQLFARMPALLSPLENPSWLETISHKVMRLACPFALGALAAGSVASLLDGALPLGDRRVAAALVAAQALFYGAAALGARAGRAGRVARTFVVLHAAAVAGLARELGGGQRVTW